MQILQHITYQLVKKAMKEYTSKSIIKTMLWYNKLWYDMQVGIKAWKMTPIIKVWISDNMCISTLKYWIDN